jgi:CubicO group peptidase (beta-lactamase class C family)
MKDARVPSLSLAVIHDSKIVYSKGLGVRNIDTGEPVNEETIFEAGSLSKPVFAYAVLKLVGQGIINLDEPLHKYLPYKDIEQDSRYKLITARMVLSHTTGFVNLRWINPEKKLDLKFAPGERFWYSDHPEMSPGRRLRQRRINAAHRRGAAQCPEPSGRRTPGRGDGSRCR